MNGYCFLHDREYPLVEPDDVCPVCLSAKEKDLQWRSTEADITVGEMGDRNE